MPLLRLKIQIFFKNYQNFKSDNTQNIFKLYQKSKLLYVLNSTSLIETLNLNIPSIIIFSKMKNLAILEQKCLKN